MKLPLNTEVLEGGHIDLLCLSTYINSNSFSKTGLCWASTADYTSVSVRFPSLLTDRITSGQTDSSPSIKPWRWILRQPSSWHPIILNSSLIAIKWRFKIAQRDVGMTVGSQAQFLNKFTLNSHVFIGTLYEQSLDSMFPPIYAHQNHLTDRKLTSNLWQCGCFAYTHNAIVIR